MKNQKNLSVSGMKKLAKKQEFVDLVSKVLVTQAKAEVVREKVNAYLAPVFAKYELYDDEDQKITSPDNIYLSDDEESIKSYYNDCDVAHSENEFAHIVEGKPGYCPALIAESEHCKAQNSLRKYGEEYFNLPEIWNLDHMREFEHMLISMAVAAHGKAKLLKQGKKLIEVEPCIQ